MQWHPWATHQHQQPYRHGDETLPQIAASAPNENQMLQAPHMKYLERDENDCVHIMEKLDTDDFYLRVTILVEVEMGGV